MDIRLEKNLCGWGLVSSVLLSFIPCLGVFFSLAGLIAYIVGIFMLSKKLNPDILKNFVLSVVTFIIPMIILYISLIVISFAKIESTDFVYFMPFVVGLIFYIGALISAHFSRKYLEIIYQSTGHKTFDYAAKGVFWGTIALILPSLIGWIIAMVGFLTLPDYIENQNTST
ncbi:MAG: DUF996 domain-containing protein [Candidatus Calescibacterium sp.]|nr:DUF996 domain-containing protein [Candidatus Calescibacterium sp.]MCX7971774.1 DUF996 domain-containing protein [bacterium]MDW8195380.1 DUF996 domain-containing protein [Candidatus Calescibacterium sp.]